jgi:hypothetical protein|mmetsp:Transcript_64617/g.144376  ORF Transcript_64617/g.144376 Transcript_64617/m.144376 type:complete len:89 (+) Transcript_64617:973-1239(+)
MRSCRVDAPLGLKRLGAAAMPRSTAMAHATAPQVAKSIVCVWQFLEFGLQKRRCVAERCREQCAACSLCLLRYVRLQLVQCAQGYMAV